MNVPSGSEKQKLYSLNRRPLYNVLYSREFKEKNFSEVLKEIGKLLSNKKPGRTLSP